MCEVCVRCVCQTHSGGQTGSARGSYRQGRGAALLLAVGAVLGLQRLPRHSVLVPPAGDVLQDTTEQGNSVKQGNSVMQCKAV